jgi:hypothetical protein
MAAVSTGRSRIFEQWKLALARLITNQMSLSHWREAREICESKRGGKGLLYYGEA